MARASVGTAFLLLAFFSRFMDASVRFTYAIHLDVRGLDREAVDLRDLDRERDADRLAAPRRARLLRPRPPMSLLS